MGAIKSPPFSRARVLRERPGGTVIGDVRASQALFDEIARLGGKPLMWRSGHAPIKAKMAEIGAPLAGEMSGHIFFADRYYGFDDALYAALRMLKLIADEGRFARRPEGRAAAPSEHAGDPLLLPRRAQVPGRPRGSGTACDCGRDVQRYRRGSGRRVRTAGGCYAHPTPSPCWWRAARRATPPPCSA